MSVSWMEPAEHSLRLAARWGITSAARAGSRSVGEAGSGARTRPFGIDVLACPRCGGRLALIAIVEDSAVIGRILRDLGLQATIPEPCPARAPPLALAS